MSASHSFPSSLTHGPCHQSQAVMAALVNERGIEPGFSTVVFITYHFLFYLLPKVLPKAEHPFQRLQKDISRCPSQDLTSMHFVCMDMFFGCPVANATAKATVKSVIRSSL